ncbi:MAG: hypothetical protein LUD02_07000 [Tannerellaceae bacterium]|nr:hypothetical protein [Tannerellaceae bacterium]
MENKYLNYTADQLVNDEYFLRRERENTRAEKNCWDELAVRDSNFAHELQLARTVLELIDKKNNKGQLPAKEELALWQEIEVSKNRYNYQQNRPIWIKRSISVAASFLLLVFALLTFMPEAEEEVDYSSLISATSSLINNKEQNITLILSEEKEISLDGKEAIVNYQEGYVEINTDAGEEKKTNDAHDPFNKLIVPKGKCSFVTLADGTQIWVNAGTIVVYPIEFTGNKREFM